MCNQARKIDQWIIDSEHRERDAATGRHAVGYAVHAADGRKGYLRPVDGKLKFLEQLDLFVAPAPADLFVEACKPLTDEQREREYKKTAQGLRF